MAADRVGGRPCLYVLVSQRICLGRRPELTGGGLIRSLGGWSAVKSMRRLREHVKSDERILGDSDFVQSVLSASKLLGISQPAVTRAAYRGEAIAAANNLNLVETHNA